ncbi:unnamed protein product [Periconia digitata]|uniref:Uncharacterized protein n=1 Tax=Periconia digitata TaxID=1303443 RepID=A0A9W4U900_9PLEO|nr:unnamed protein product [Periconia digitata]
MGARRFGTWTWLAVRAFDGNRRIPPRRPKSPLFLACVGGCIAITTTKSSLPCLHSIPVHLISTHPPCLTLQLFPTSHFHILLHPRIILSCLVLFPLSLFHISPHLHLPFMPITIATQHTLESPSAVTRIHAHVPRALDHCTVGSTCGSVFRQHCAQECKQYANLGLLTIVLLLCKFYVCLHVSREKTFRLVKIHESLQPSHTGVHELSSPTTSNYPNYRYRRLCATFIYDAGGPLSISALVMCKSQDDASTCSST